MPALQRHQLALLTDTGWQGLLDAAWDAEAFDGLVHWARHRLPLVVTRQRPQAGGEGRGAPGHADAVCLGLPAPGRWNRRRIALVVPRDGIAGWAEFPDALDVSPLLPAEHRAPWHAVCAALSHLGVRPRVYGSHGWQLLTGLDHLRPGSDIDLCIRVQDPAQADAVATLLQAWPADAPRLDGELLFEDGAAVAWREWLAWRTRRTACVLVKRIGGAALCSAPFWRTLEPA